ncbi:SDR family oxidoreductase [Demequina capsici]|uniref:SDR family oxidoreductase n=1 Tax=Demequina capsici TaxID=3075620 RepID=A0AA96FD90_9MICO|nr:SDR family oxidoreductase [Demequina sp. PMTSA13]WNM28008.1 SDR family oxidoreductase [Demequina sp. PMTSA13]
MSGITSPIALVTGANRGIGRATVEELARRGHDIVLTYRSHADEAAEAVRVVEAEGRRAVALQLDIADAAAIEPFVAALRAALHETWGATTIDALVNNGGMGATTTLGTTGVQVLDELFATHVRGVYLLTQALATPAEGDPLLADGGSIVNLGTGLTRFVHVGRDAYAAMKGAVGVLTGYWAQELGPRGIRVNTVAPGPVETQFSGWVGDDTQRKVFADATALGRSSVASDIAGVIATLVEPGAAWVTAQRIEASGGYRL